MQCNSMVGSQQDALAMCYQALPGHMITSPPRYVINITNDILKLFLPDMFFCGENNHKTMRASDYDVLQNVRMPWNDRIPPNCLSLWQPPVTTHPPNLTPPIHTNDPLPVLIPLVPLAPNLNHSYHGYHSKSFPTYLRYISLRLEVQRLESVLRKKEQQD